MQVFFWREVSADALCFPGILYGFQSVSDFRYYVEGYEESHRIIFLSLAASITATSVFSVLLCFLCSLFFVDNLFPGTMPSDLFVPHHRGGSFHQVDTFEHSIPAVLLLNFQGCFLQVALLPVVFCFFSFLTL